MEFKSYRGYDVSSTAVARCREKFAHDTSKSFRLLEEYSGETADVTLSLDVIYHLIENAVFEQHTRTLFSAARRYVVIYSSNTDEVKPDHATHVRHRKFTGWIEKNIEGWRLMRQVPNRFPWNGDPEASSHAHFCIYERSKQ
jgi:hypothetical protein